MIDSKLALPVGYLRGVAIMLALKMFDSKINTFS